MSHLAFTDDIIIDQKRLREQLVDKVEVLDKVKKLFLIPDFEIMTMHQVADYYNVDYNTIQLCYHRNKIEINQDGVVVKSSKEFLTLQDVRLETMKGKSLIHFFNNTTLEIPNRGIKCFSKRAILRIGMLLRDSEVAKEIRTQLLNTFEQTTTEQKTTTIDEEQNLMAEIGKAFLYGDKQELVVAFNNAFAFKNRYIAQIEESNLQLVTLNETLKEDNRIIAGKMLEWTDRSSLNRAVRVLARNTSKHYGTIFKELYEELRYAHNIGLSQRGKPPLIQHIREDEWNLVIQVFASLCEKYDCNPSVIFEKAKILDDENERQVAV